MSSYKVLLLYTEQRWSDSNDSQAATDVARKSRRRSDVSDETIDENTGTYLWFIFVRHKISCIL